MKTKSYSKDQVQYGYSPRHRKWSFEVGTFQFLSNVPGGAVTAHKIAGAVSGAHKRAQKKSQPFTELDNLARANVNQYISSTVTA